MQNLHFTMNYMYMYYGRTRLKLKKSERGGTVAAGRSDMSVQKCSDKVSFVLYTFA